jgi:serine/threonine protein kinase
VRRSWRERYQRAAIKLLQPEAVAQLERFHAEGQILARLEHPGIARLYDGGVAADGRPCMVLEFVEGAPIAARCAQTRVFRLQPIRRLGAQGLAGAHDRARCQCHG